MATSPKMKFHKLAEMFDPLEPDEFAALVKDIETHGLRQPIDVCDGKIVDGRNRYNACLKAGVEPKFHERRFATEEALRAFIISANLIRRHLTAEKKRELIALLVKAEPEKSNRQIAEITNSNRNTVGRVRSELEASGDVSPSDTRTDTQGRSQPSTKKPRGNGSANPATNNVVELRPEQQGEQVEQAEAADPVAGTLQRAAQDKANAETAELATRELQAKAAQLLPGAIGPQLEDGALMAVDAATLAKRETLAAEIRGLMGKGEPVTSEQPDDDDAEIQKLLALDDAELAKLVAEKTDAERQEMRAALDVSQPHLRSLYNLGVRLEGLLGNTATDAIGPMADGDELHKENNYTKLIRAWTMFKEMWLRASPAARQRFLADFGNEIADVFQPAKKPAGGKKAPIAETADKAAEKAAAKSASKRSNKK